MKGKTRLQSDQIQKQTSYVCNLRLALQKKKLDNLNPIEIHCKYDFK